METACLDVCVHLVRKPNLTLEVHCFILLKKMPMRVPYVMSMRKIKYTCFCIVRYTMTYTPEIVMCHRKCTARQCFF